MQQTEIALQLWTVRHEMLADLPATLAAVAGAGYRAVELAGLHDVPAERLASLLAANELRPVASHEGIERLRGDLDMVADRMGVLGCDRVIVPWLPEEDRASGGAVRRVAGELASFAARLGDRGLRLGFHNHDVEFAALDGSTVWEALLDALPPDVEIELDVFWAAAGGADPVAEIHRLGSRVRLLHVKDRAAATDPDAPPRDAPVGTGTLPIADIVAAGRRAGVAWYIVEQDEAADPLADIATSYRALAAMAS